MDQYREVTNYHIKRLSRLINDPKVEKKEVDGYPDYIVFDTGDIYSQKSNKFLGDHKDGTYSPTVWLYDTHSDGTRECMTRARVVGNAFIEKPEEACDACRQVVVCDYDYSVGNLYWGYQEEVRRGNMDRINNKIKTQIAIEKHEEAQSRMESGGSRKTYTTFIILGVLALLVVMYGASK